MNRSRLFLVILALLCLANIGWRIWASWGLITIDANEQPLSEIARSIEKQAGIRLATNLPADTKVTMHVRKVPLLHALDVLGASAGGNWSVAYFAAPDKGSIDTALATMANGQELEGWKRWAFPAMRGMGDDEGASDPRLEVWQTKPAPEGNLHTYLEQASRVLSVQFWAPEQWNPTISASPKAGKITKVMPKLAKAAHGQSAELFLLRGRPQPPPAVAEASGNERAANRSAGRPPGGGFAAGGFGGLPNEDMLKIMEERERARIERLPKAKKAEALAELEERRKFIEEMSRLSPEERRAKIEAAIEQRMNDTAAVARMEAGSTKRSAMQTAEQRAERWRGYLDRKRQGNQ